MIYFWMSLYFVIKLCPGVHVYTSTKQLVYPPRIYEAEYLLSLSNTSISNLMVFLQAI